MVARPRWASSLVLLTCALGCAGASDDEGPTGSQGGSSTGGGGNLGAGTPAVSDFPDAQTYVDGHNAVRAAVQQPAGYPGAWAPVPPVTWSDEVAATAQAWAEKLKSEMDCGLMHASGTGYGENLAAGSNVDARRAVDMWASEIENYTWSPKYEFENDTGHYTQIVWRETKQIGCGRAMCAGRSVVVCRYSPPGNFIGRQPY